MGDHTARDLVLYTDNRLPCPQRVLLTAAELGLKLTTIQIDILKSEHKTPEYSSLTHNFSTVPFLKHTTNAAEAFTLRESRAISRYLCLLHRDQEEPQSRASHQTQNLLPPTTDLLGTAKFEEAASTEVTSFDPVANRLVFEAYFNPIFGGETNETVVKELRGRLEGVLDGLERELGCAVGDRRGGRKYMAGDVFTIVDIFYVPYMHKLVLLYGEELFQGRERLWGWWQRVSRRESVRLIGGLK